MSQMPNLQHPLLLLVVGGWPSNHLLPLPQPLLLPLLLLLLPL
jgi:hypothetical protein